MTLERRGFTRPLEPRFVMKWKNLNLRNSCKKQQADESGSDSHSAWPAPLTDTGLPAPPWRALQESRGARSCSTSDLARGRSDGRTPPSRQGSKLLDVRVSVE